MLDKTSYVCDGIKRTHKNVIFYDQMLKLIIRQWYSGCITV